MAAINETFRRNRALYMGLVLLLVPWVVTSFEIFLPSVLVTSSRYPSFTRQQRSSSTLAPPFRTQAQDTDAPIGEEEGPVQRDEPSSSSTTAPPTQRQHWLDLRGTAIRPDEASAFLDEFLLKDDDKTKEKEKDQEEQESSPSITNWIDCIIVPSGTFREISPRNVASKVDLLIVDDDNSNSNQSKLVHDATGDIKGIFMSTDASTFLNPLDTLDLYNKGDWILFESGDNVDNNNDTNELTAWVEKIGSLLQLLPATAVPETMETPSGLILPSSSSLSSSTLTSRDGSVAEPPAMPQRGGVGIYCTTRQAVFSVDALLEQVLSSASTTESPESGILLLTTNASDVVDIPITSALILPFDLNLWRAVLELRQETR